jgi:hypothetical protein
MSATFPINKNVPIRFGSLIIKTNLLILGLDSVDIILGTDWLSRHQAVLDIAARAIEIHSPTCGETTLYLPDVGAKAETPPFARSLRCLAAALTETKQAGTPFA